MYEMCLSQVLPQRGFVSLFSMEAILSALIWVTRAPVFVFLFLKGQNESLAGAEELISEGEVWGQDQVKMPTEQERHCSERSGSKAGLQPRWSN